MPAISTEQFVFVDTHILPTSLRRIHIRRLFDVLQISIQRRDIQRAKRVWAILARCRETKWMGLWPTAVRILALEHTSEVQSSDTPEDDTIAFLRVMMLQYPHDRENILRELVVDLVISGKCQDALNELELYLPIFPYQENPVLHMFAGFITMYLAQTVSETSCVFLFSGALRPIFTGTASVITYDHHKLRDAESHFRRAIDLDTEKILPPIYMEKVNEILRRDSTQINEDRESEEETDMDVDSHDTQTKRARIATAK